MRTRVRRNFFALIAVLATSGANSAELTADMSTAEAVISPITTHHSVRIAAETIRYTAIFSETLLSSDGKPQATISATTYLREDLETRPDRPVVFAFNGGPGASSSPLHFGSLGPRRWSGSGNARTLIENPFSVIDAADLVFIDPVGTGFSRARPNGDPTSYWSIGGDAQAALVLIRSWLVEHGRTQAPIFIVGESYGGFRLATMAKQLDDLPIAGLIFVSPLLDASAAADSPGNDMAYVFQFPSLATTAWFHNKIKKNGRTVAQVFDEAARFAQSDLLIALQQGATLSAGDRKKLATRMSELCGLPSTLIASLSLRIDSQQFLETLLADRNQLVGRVDTRVTAPKPTTPPKDPSRAPAADDPALGLKGSNVIKSTTIKSYFERDLGVKTSRDYLSLTLDVNFRWNWRAPDNVTGFYVNASPNLKTLMSKKPSARVLLVGGYFDLATPLLAPRSALTHAEIALDRVAMHAFEGGHSPFESEPQLERFSKLLRDFIRVH